MVRVVVAAHLYGGARITTGEGTNMSDTPQGPGWWLASDGKYYPPESRTTPPPPPPAEARSTAGDTVDAGASPTGAAAAGDNPAGGATVATGSEAAKAKPRKVVLAAVTAVAVIAAGGTFFAATKVLGGGGDPTVPGPDAIGVRFTLLTFDGHVGGTAGRCWGTRGYDDFGAGMDIRILDEDNKLIGSGNTQSLEKLSQNAPEFFDAIDIGDRQLDEDAEVGCDVAALVPLRSRAEFYRVEIGRRGETTHTREELEENDWWVQLSLGP